MSDDTDSPPTSVTAVDTFITSPSHVSFGFSENSADDGMLTSSASYERSSASNVTSLGPGEMHETDRAKNPVGSSLRNPGFTTEPSSAEYLPTTTNTTDNNIAPVYTADNPPTIRLSAADNAPTSDELSRLDLPMSVATDNLPADVSTQELTNSDIRPTSSSSTDNLLTPVSKAVDVLPSSADDALNSSFISMSETTDNLLTDLIVAETNAGSTGTSMLSDDQLPTSDILLTSSSTADNPLTPVPKADESSPSSADDAMNSSYISNELSFLDATEASILVRSSLGSENQTLSAIREGLSSANKEIEGLPSATSEGLSSAKIEIGLPSATGENISSAKIEGLSSATSENLSFAEGEGLSSATNESLSSATSENLSFAKGEGLSSATSENLSSATSENLSSAEIEGLSSATSENLSSAEIEGLSSATSESFSSSGPEVKPLRGTTSGKLDLPSDYHTTSSADDHHQTRTSATVDQSSGTRARRYHVTSPTHVTGNRTGPTTYFDQFDEYQNRVPNGNEIHSPTRSTESKALHISTNNLFSSSSLTSSGVPFANSTLESSGRVSSNLAQFSILFGTLSAFAIALLLLNCIVILLSAKRKDRRQYRRRSCVTRNISTISFRQISTQLDATTVINVIIDEEDEEEEEGWTDDSVDLLTHSPEVIDPSSPSSAAVETRAVPEEEEEGDGGRDVPAATRSPGLEPGALELEGVGARRSPGATGGAGEKRRRRTGESRRNGEAKGGRRTAGGGSTGGKTWSSGPRSLPPPIPLQSASLRPSEEEPLSTVSTFTRSSHL